MTGAQQEAGRYPLQAPRDARLDLVALEFLNYMEVERGASGNTVSAYGRGLSRYTRFLYELGIYEPAHIEKEALLLFAGCLASPEGYDLSSRSVAQVFSVVRMFHRFMVMEGYCSKDPSDVLSSPKLPQRLPRPLSREQVKRLLEAPRGDGPRQTRDRFMLELLYATGMRISELVGLDVGSLDLDECLVTCHGKGNKWRLVPFGLQASVAAEAYLSDARPEILGRKRETALVLNMRGGRLTRQGCWKVIKGYAKDIALSEQVTPHVLRHTCATHLLEGGASLPVVAEMLGHVSIATTQIYTRVTREHLKDVYRRSHPRGR